MTLLPSLNDYIHALNINRYKGNALKREAQDEIIRAIKLSKIAPVERYPVHITFEWHERSRRRDLDNIASAKKFILDALQEAGILDGDGQKQIKGFRDSFCIPDDWDGVVVLIYQPIKIQEVGRNECENRKNDATAEGAGAGMG